MAEETTAIAPLPNEVWKDVLEYEGFYQVSNYGNVRSVERVIRHNSKDGKHALRKLRSKLIRKELNCNGYYIVGLHKNGTHVKRTIHRLVAIAFIPNPDGKETVNHKDGDRANNNMENLEWCSQSENIIHASRILHTLTYHGKSVRCVETGEIFPSIKKAAQKYGVAGTNLGNAIRGKGQNRCAGYHWEYI